MIKNDWNGPTYQTLGNIKEWSSSLWLLFAWILSGEKDTSQNMTLLAHHAHWGECLQKYCVTPDVGMGVCEHKSLTLAKTPDPI